MDVDLNKVKEGPSSCPALSGEGEEDGEVSGWSNVEEGTWGVGSPAG